ncbi:hypothetical protein GRS48_11800 [Halorubrum sp. JWXQ-INN 858]|uniref:DUF7344 domain-containing protein n=1 Tax=Halorubrum sp. JWXQ-INN 858 TaxID=2690782 RepID=UPI001356E2C4|nr:hypothetical protein [Halorubrum sp. JWXQ-INN 858]MWV65495.1 hypothetical protein [Halorubrum sp. JWXQ-INN 858]
MTDRNEPLAVDDALALLAASRRRALIGSLMDADDPRIHVDDLIDDLIDDLSADPRISVDDRDRFCTELYHRHLPKLCSEGVIDFDRDAGVVRYRSDPTVEDLAEFLAEELER